MSHPLMPHQIDANEVKQADDQQTAAQTDKALVAAPVTRDQAGTAINPDPNAEHIIVGVEFGALAAGTLYFENANGGGSARKSITYNFPATFNSGLLPTWIPMGKGLPIQYTTTGTNPTVSIKIHYITKKYGLQR